MSGARPLRDLRRFARAGLVSAWVVFWLNSALFPCCEVTAAVLGGHADNASQVASALAPAHHSDAAHSEPLHDSPESPCSDTLTSTPPVAAAYEGLTPDRLTLQWFAVAAPVSAGFADVTHPANFALARAAPPPSLRLYLRTQRLLI